MLNVMHHVIYSNESTEWINNIFHFLLMEWNVNLWREIHVHKKDISMYVLYTILSYAICICFIYIEVRGRGDYDGIWIIMLLFLYAIAWSSMVIT